MINSLVYYYNYSQYLDKVDWPFPSPIPLDRWVRQQLGTVEWQMHYSFYIQHRQGFHLKHWM